MDGGGVLLEFLRCFLEMAIEGSIECNLEQSPYSILAMCSSKDLTTRNDS
jgi:hypothetical protein